MENKKHRISIALAYRWITIEMYEAQIRHRLTERGMTSADQNTLLEWAKEWKPTRKNPGVKAKRKDRAPYEDDADKLP